MWINYMYNDSHIAISAPGTYVSGYESCKIGCGSYVDGNIEYINTPVITFDNLSGDTRGVTITNGQSFTYIKLDYSAIPFKMASAGAMSIDANGPLNINASNDLTLSSDGSDVIISAEHNIYLNPSTLAYYYAGTAIDNFTNFNNAALNLYQEWYLSVPKTSKPFCIMSDIDTSVVGASQYLGGEIFPIFNYSGSPYFYSIELKQTVIDVNNAREVNYHIICVKESSSATTWECIKYERIVTPVTL